MQKYIAKFLAIILCLSVVLCGCSNGPATPTNTVTISTETDVREYPGETGIDLPKYANIVPEIVFTTTGEENGLIGELYMVMGTVEELFYGESGAGYLRVSTFRGDLVIADAVDTIRFSDNPELKSSIDFNIMRDYFPLPQEGEFCVIFAEYQGMSNTFECPFFMYASQDYLLDAVRLSLRDEGEGAGDEDPTSAESDKTDSSETKPTAQKPKDTTETTTVATQPTTSPTQSTEPSSEATQPTQDTEPVQVPQSGPTTGEKNALAKAKQYLKHSAFSYSGLIDQLEYEGYSNTEAKYGADNCGADWNEQAVAKAKQYLKHSAFSHSGLIDQLEYEGFTSTQAEHGADKCGADWYEQAAKKAQQYMDYKSFSRTELINQLKYEGFTQAQAEHGANSVGCN